MLLSAVRDFTRGLDILIMILFYVCLFLLVKKVHKRRGMFEFALNRKRELVVTSFQNARSVNGLQKRCISVYLYI